MASQPTSDDSAVLDFLLLFAEDESAGATRGIDHYRERFPGHELAIDAAFQRRTAPTPVSRSERRIGPYRVLRELGRGGQGAVYLAEDTRSPRQVALKVLDSFAAWRSSERVERLRREAAVVAKLQHPAICTVLDSDLDAEPPYLAMRIVDGSTLAHVVALARDDGVRSPTLACPPRTRLELDALLGFFDRTARALHSAHEAGVVHRDVKPGNIMVTPDGEPVLLDFGLARESDSTHETLTHSGQLFGTPAYMAPERIKASGAGVDRRCDIYSLGVTLFECLTLARPFEGGDPESLFRSIAHDETPDARRVNALVSQDLQVVLATAMEKDRRRRYATALEFADELRRVREYEPIRARPASSWRRVQRWSQRNPALAFTSAAIFTALLVGLLVSQHLLAQREEARRRLEGLSLGTLSLTLVNDDPTRSLLLAIESAAIEREYYGDTALFAALAECRELRKHEFNPNLCRCTDVSPDSRYLALAGDQTAVEVRDLASGARLAALEGHTDFVVCVRFSPDSRSLVSASRDGRAIVWDVERGKARFELGGHSAFVRWAEFDPGGTQIVTASIDGTARLWSAADGRELHVLAGHAGAVTRASFDARGERVLTLSGTPILTATGLEGSTDHSARIWDARTGNSSVVLVGHSGAITDARFDASGARVVTASEDRSVRVWDATTGEQLRVFLHTSPVRCAVLCGDDRVIAGDEHGLRAWSASGAYEEWKGHLDRPVNALALSPDGTRIVSGSSDLTARIWDIASGRSLATLRRAEHRITDCRWSVDGRWIVTTTWSTGVNVWYANEPPGIAVLAREGPVASALSFSPDGRSLAVPAFDGTLRLWQRTGDEWTLRSSLKLGASRLRSAAFDASGARLIVASEDGGATLLELRRDGGPFDLRGHTAAVHGAMFAASGREALTWSDDGTARVWNLDDGATIAVLAAGDAVTDAAFSPDGARVALCGSDRSVALFDARSGARTNSFGPFGLSDIGTPVDAFVAFSPDGSKLLTAGQDPYTRVIDVATGATRELAIAGFPGRPSFSSDGARILVTARWNPIACVFDAGTFEKLATIGDREFGAHASTLTACELSADSKTVLTASSDCTVRLWNMQDGTRRARFPAQAAAITSARFTPDGRWVATADASGGLRVWPVDPLPAALARKPRELNRAERERYRDL